VFFLNKKDINSFGKIYGKVFNVKNMQKAFREVALKFLIWAMVFVYGKKLCFIYWVLMFEWYLNQYHFL